MIISHHSQFTPAGPNSTEPAPDNARFLCATCWRLFPARIPGRFSSPYGIDRAGGLHCLDCCHLRDVQELKDRGKAFFAYLSQDGRTITNWPGVNWGGPILSGIPARVGMAPLFTVSTFETCTGNGGKGEGRARVCVALCGP